MRKVFRGLSNNYVLLREETFCFEGVLLTIITTETEAKTMLKVSIARFEVSVEIVLDRRTQFPGPLFQELYQDTEVTQAYYRQAKGKEEWFHRTPYGFSVWKQKGLNESHTNNIDMSEELP